MRAHTNKHHVIRSRIRASMIIVLGVYSCNVCVYSQFKVYVHSVCSLSFQGHEAVQDADQFGEGQASAAVLVTNVDCSGEETSIHNCSNSTDIRGCSHSEDAAVVCNISNYNEGG